MIGLFAGEAPLMQGYTAGEGFFAGLQRLRSQYVRIHHALVGDPTVRAQIVKPVDTGTPQNPTPVTATINLGTATTALSWQPSGDASATGFLGYHVYRAASLDGTFTRITGTTPQSGLTFSDTNNPNNHRVYMVRPIKTEVDGHPTNPSFTYENASTGVFASAVTFTGTSNPDTLLMRRHIGTGTDTTNEIQVWTSDTTAGTPNYKIEWRTTNTLEVKGGSGNDTLILDFANGTPVPGGGLTYNGEGNTLFGVRDSFTVRGTASVADTIVVSSGSAIVNTTSTVTLISAETINVDGRSGGGDVLNVHGTSGADLIEFNDGVIFTSRTINYTGVEHLGFDGNLGNDSFIVQSSHSASITIALTDDQEFGTFSIASGKLVDLDDNKMVVHGGSYSVITDLISTARNGSHAWDGTSGLTSTAAKNDTNDDTTLGVLTYSQYASVGGSTFAGVTLTLGDLLIRYTYYGDSDFNGIVNFDDYARIDAGFSSGTGNEWFEGDCDFNDVVNFDDYALIDLAFGNGGGQLMSGPGDGNPFLIQLGQMEHFTQSFMNFFIDWNIDNLGIYYTQDDFFPDGLPW
jgi:hypothetical protein